MFDETAEFAAEVSKLVISSLDHRVRVTYESRGLEDRYPPGHSHGRMLLQHLLDNILRSHSLREVYTRQICTQGWNMNRVRSHEGRVDDDPL